MPLRQLLIRFGKHDHPIARVAKIPNVKECISACALRRFFLANRADMPDTGFVKGSEFLKKVRTEAKTNGVFYRWAPSRGKGSHGTVYYDANQTVVKDLKKDIGVGLLSDMKKHLGVSF